ncbi:MAG TPA: aromatic ring-hydroxylating dioxygenase subunit alpha [Kiloniellaceae bacterium]|nr:aromatic ring-hydroxylating dioxygenase subunit alpha [Kiloniellaceae bacterium]
MSSWLPREIEAQREALQQVLLPIAEARGLPNTAYTSGSFAAVERDQVLARGWTCIGVGHWVPQPGDLRPVRLLGLPLLMLRDAAGNLKVFHNVCSHRGLELVAGPGRSKGLIRCPYHSWSYDLDGNLKATPFVGGPGTRDCPGFDRTRHGLKPVRSAVWCDAVFVDLSGEAEDFETFIAPLAERWKAFDSDRLRHGGADSAFTIEVACNWKLAVENYCEAYHLPWIHPSLNQYSRLEDHYNIAVEGHMAGQGSTAYRPTLSDDGRAFPEHPDLPEAWRGAAEYLALFPNVLFGIHADHFYTVVLEPLGPDRTREHFEIYYFGEAALGDDLADLRAANTHQWRGIFEEDRGVVEGMQAGRASPAFRGGVFSPAMDGPTHCFHQWMAGRLLT